MDWTGLSPPGLNPAHLHYIIIASTQPASELPIVKTEDAQQSERVWLQSNIADNFATLI